MSNKKSDYKKPHMDLVELLPEPLQSDVNLSLFNNVFNRYLTKPETEKVAGYIGRGNKAAIVPRQIKEPDVHRQAFQLQPIPYNKIGSVEHMASWVDIQKELERLGVDIEDFSKWGATEKFNWVPPIDINKIVNYRDYYWDGASTELPQYITIRSRCATATARLNFWEGLITQYGLTFPVDDILEIDDPGSLTSYVINNINSTTSNIFITGDARDDIQLNNFINVISTTSNNGTHKIIAIPTYNGITNTTTLETDSTLVDETPTSGVLLLRRFDKIVILPNTETPTGDYTDLFEEGFVFFYRNSSNAELNNSFLRTVESTYDPDTLKTTVVISITVTDDNASGELSLAEELSFFETNKTCNCEENGGWDIGLWDDNPDEPLWGDDEDSDGNPPGDGISDYLNLIDRISHPTPPPAAGAQGELWYDTVGDVLYQYGTALDWLIMFNNFSLILDEVTGLNLWDLSSSCAESSLIDAVNQWVDQNKWVHKNEITNFANVRRANQPIIEYDWDLELNEWTYTKYNWAYRSEKDAEYSAVDTLPPLIEITPIVWWEQADTIGTTVILDDRYGDLTEYFVAGRQIFVGDDTFKDLLFVEYSEYKSSPASHPYRTFVTLTTRAPDGGDLANAIPHQYSLYPFETINGDVWKGYGLHWLFLNASDSLPIPHQPKNPYMPISDTAVAQPGGGSPAEYTFTTSLYAQNYLTGTSTQQTFYLNSAIPSESTRPLNRMALFGFDDIRVYSADAVLGDPIREFGTYDEIGEAVFDIVSIDFVTNEFVIGGGDQSLIGVDFSTYFAPGNQIRVADNNVLGTALFEVVSVNTQNKIKVVETIPPTTSVSGNISNVSVPIIDSGFVNSRNVTIYVIGIEFFIPRLFNVNIRIIVGETALSDIGFGVIKVRTIEDDTQYDIFGDNAISNTTHRFVEQLKTKTNQYPLFDIYDVEGEPAYKANPIFGYRTSPDQEINQSTGFRIVYDAAHDIYAFDQFLLEEDDGELFAYRDYANRVNDIWYNEEKQEIKFWEEITWSDRKDVSGQYRKAIVSDVEPDTRLREINGLYWYNTATDRLFKRFIGATPSQSTWVEIVNIDRAVTDINLQTIWKGGLNEEQYIPDKVDWVRRSLLEYQEERDDFVIARAEELMINDGTLTEAQALILATIEWFDNQKNHISTTGAWVGDWEIPDPLYFNHMHENRKYLNSRELLTHFTTIINEQVALPGFNGTKDGLFSLIHTHDVNYALGGTIKEFNNGFDTLISSVLVNNVTPRSLIEFAHDQYESLLNTITEIYRKNAVDLLSNTEAENIIDISTYSANAVILKYELNDLGDFVYGDSTTFTDVDGVNDLGVRNWIATLPYLNLIRKFVPERIVDDTLGLNEIVHHDSHRNSYELTSASIDIISKLLIGQEDPRLSGSNLGEQSSSLPVNNIAEFDAVFGSTTNRAGVYWYKNSSPVTLYRYTVVSAGSSEPTQAYADGTLWMDLTTGAETLRIRNTSPVGVVSWDIVDGLILGDGRLHNGTDPTDLTTATISAWTVMDLDIVLGDIIFELENRLYENAPDHILLNYDFETTIQNNPAKYAQYLEEAFLDYVSQQEIENPYKNSAFDATNPFTWNYKKSVSGSSANIVSVDGQTNSFVVSGDVSNFLSTAPRFFVKNSEFNNGTWTPISATYDAGTGLTTAFVNEDVVDDTRGLLYNGQLPSLITTSSPNNLNDGSESGGDWRDLYEKIYNTPYPHQEPWVLQGYRTRPDWWMSAYSNDNIEQWGERRWKYKHGFDIKSVDAVNDTTNIAGDFVEVFVSDGTITIDNSNIPDNTYTIKRLDTITAVNVGPGGIASIVITSPFIASYSIGMRFAISTPLTVSSEIKNVYTISGVVTSAGLVTIVVDEEIQAGDIVVGTDYINGTLFNPFTNETTIYFVDDLTTLSSGRLAKRYGMWENILTGVIPPGKTYPNEVVAITGIPSVDDVPALPGFVYFSVNVDNVPVSTDGGITTFMPDDILPPFWDHTLVYGLIPTTDIIVRSLYFNFSNEIISPNANYVFGDSGNVEWEWKSSSQFLYDHLTVAYRLDPANFIYQTFGFNFTTIGGLLIDRDVRNTASHTRTNFHGDVVDNKQFISNGLNQWYVNFNRFEGYDANFSDFQSLWTLWNAPIAYQFSSFVDTPSLDVGHRFLDLVDFDYSITSKRSPGTDDFWLDALKIQILELPVNIIEYNNQIDWLLELRTNISRSRTLEYYDMRNYQFYVDTNTNECKLYTWEIINVDTFNSTFTINGNQIDLFISGRTFTVTNSAGNNNTYEIFASVYDGVSKTTTIEVNNIVISPTVDGLITLAYRSFPWETKDEVYLSSTQLLPSPLIGDSFYGTTKYFLIKTSDVTFKLALTKAAAEDDDPINITTIGVGDHFVGELLSTFDTEQSKNINWRQYAIDKTNLLSFSTPSQIQGMQPFVDFVRGYDAALADNGWIINEDRSLRDPDTGDIISWRVELERFINYAYSTISRRAEINNLYPATVNITKNEWTFDNTNTVFITGDPINVLSSNAGYPQPISPQIVYFIIRDTLETFRLAATRVDAAEGNAILLTPTVGIGNLSIMKPTQGKNLIPPFEMNAFRNSAWFNQPSGIVSNIITGPVDDIRTTQLIFDQAGNRINVDQLRVYRQDKQTKIVIENAAQTAPTATFVNPVYNLVHLGGLHIFTDAYEHVMLFNNYSTNENLLYDPFIGLNVTKYELVFNRNPETTQRPNVGGYYLETFFNQGANIKENFEAGVESIRNAYDTYDVLESNKLTKHSRDVLGYDGETEYLDNLNLTKKSQFVFWRGQIQSKGSVNAVTAYINSRRFIDAKIDEFWAIKIADFGSVEEKEYPEMFVTTADARSNEFKAEFILSEDTGANVTEGFVPIRISDLTRWYNQPDQLEVLRNNNKTLYFDMKAVDVKTGTDLTITPNNGNNYIVHGMDVDRLELTYEELDGSVRSLIEGTDFVYINPYIVQILPAAVIPSLTNLSVWGFVINNDAQNPARIVDRGSETQISPIEFWDPARGNHYSNAIHNVDLENKRDPAIYTDSPRLTGISSVDDERYWGIDEIGTSWMDTSTQHYIPYNSKSVISDNTVRFRVWGQLYDFASIAIYEWVESDVPPEEWDAIAEAEAGDNTIPEAIRKSGVAKYTLFENVGGFWVPAKHKVDTQYAATDSLNAAGTQFLPNSTIIDFSKGLDVYINEVKHLSDVSPSVFVLPTTATDVVKFVQPIPTDAAVIADGVEAGTLLQQYEYVIIVNYNDFDEPFNTYYFWVGDKTTKPAGHNRIMSLAEAQQQLTAIPSAYMFFQNPLPADDVVGVPNRYTQIIVRGLQGIVFDDNRYTIRFTRDFTLRDNLEPENVRLDNLELKIHHEEWKIFRQEQTGNIDKWQWDKITESIVGYLLADPLVQVPSFERQLYDAKNETDTQYGLGTGQTFVNKTLALSTILAYLTNPDIDFTPININSFFAQQSFDTPENIITAMDTIYNTFKFADVNRIYFSVLFDAFTTKTKYHGLFKTSMVSLHGIKPFQSSGVFDD